MATMYVDGKASLKATTDHLTVSFESGGETFTFHLPHHTAVGFANDATRNTWQLHCEPSGELLKFPKKKAHKSGR